jgi:hypothetical protein
MENCNEGKLLRIVFPISGVVIFYVGQPVAALCCLYISSIWKFCQSDMMAKGEYVFRVEGSGSEEETGTT